MAILLTTIMLVLLVINSILQIIIMIAQWIFELSLNLITSIDTTNVVSTGWTTSLQFANMFFIVVLLAIAIATILRLQNFNYKKMLPIFIMVALLINFSMVAGLIVLDASNMLAGFFLDSMGGVNSITGNIASSMKIVTFAMDGDQKTVDDLAADPDAAGILSKIWGSIKNVAATAVGLATGSTQIKIIMTQLLKLVVFLTTIFMFIAGSVYMIKRAFWIWLLLILAPLAWIALIFPGGNRYFTQWWGTFTKWCIFAPAFLFFIYLGFIVGNSMATASATLTSSTTLTDIAFGGFVDIISPSLFIQMAIVPFIMLMGLSLSSKLGVGGSNFVLNYADKARGAASKRFKELRSKSPLSAEKLGERFGGMGAGMLAKSRIGAVARYGRETREKLEQEKLQEAQKKETLINLRGQLDATTDPKLRLDILKQIRAAVGGKSDLDKIKDIIAKSEENKPGGASTSTAPAPTGGATH